MANRIISFRPETSRTTQQLSGIEVYLDLDKDSARNHNFIYWEKTQLSDYVMLLSTEAMTPLSDAGVLCPENQDLSGESVVAFGLAVRSGYDEKHAIYEKYTMPYRYRVSKIANVNAIQNSLHQIFTWIKGERIINPEFGSRLRLYLYEGITEQNMEAIVAEIKQCISEWEPRVVVDKVVNVQTVDDTENNTVHLEVVYRIIGLNDQQFRYTYKYHRANA